MCGIAGYLSSSRERAQPEILARMIHTLQHRGPDAETWRADGPCGLAHARLSIIDLAGGGQPMGNSDGSLWITFNGEIFNYVELRECLLERGHKFATRSDTEIILHLYEEEGETCVRHFNGQWAFAIWDRRAETLFLSRDRMGVRPLFYTQTAGAFVFASEIKAIFQFPGIRRELDVRALDDIFTFWHTLPPRTAFENIQELPPGHSMLVSTSGVQVKRYWQLDYKPIEIRDELECAAELLDKLTVATSLRLRSDVPVATYLSGGLDSTITTALVQRLSGKRMQSFSVGFEDAEFDESDYQKEAVEFLGTDHNHVRCTAHDIQRVFPQVIRQTEQPILRTAPAPMFLLSRLVRDSGFKVVVTGEGADELFGGYDIFKETKVRRFWAQRPESQLRPLLLRRLYPYLANVNSQPDVYLRAFFHNRQPAASPLFSHGPRWDLTARLKLFFSDRVRDELKGDDALSRMESSLPAGFSDWDWLCRAQYLEAAHLLPGYILSSQGDRMGMAHSVEARFPFLDPHVVDFSSRLPSILKLKVLNEKYLLKLAARHVVPESIRRRFKQPYRAPEAKCFFLPRREEYIDGLLSFSRMEKDGIFKPQAVAQLVRKFENGSAIGNKDNMALTGILSTAILMEELCNH